ncbi:MAG: ABC transporter ATP-binding protein, partial [Candidatus Helarchaeota archaeon]
NLSAGVLIIVGYTINDLMSGNLTIITSYILLIFLMSIGWPIFTLAGNFLREILAQRMERDTRKEFYANLLGKSQSFHDLQKTGDIMARATNDVRMLNFLISPALSLIIDSFTSLIVPIIYISIFFPIELIITPLCFLILFLVTLRIYSNQLSPVTAKLRSVFGQMNAYLNETLAGIEVVKSTTQESYELERYASQAKEYKNAFVEQGYIMARYMPILILAVAIAVGLAHSIILNLNSIITIGEIVSYTGLLTQLRFPTFISIFVFSIVRLAKAGADRLLEIMNKKTEISENPKGIAKKIIGSITFENVSFTYPNTKKSVLKNISFSIESGQTVAIVGTTGSGKSTLTKLISRLYDTTDGKIFIDGVDIRDFSLKSLRSQISYIEQDIFLFSTSIFENIAFGRMCSLEEVKLAAKQAQAHDFIMKLPNGYESEVGERGVQLSGGEKQRIAIARAFLTDTPILILDDSTSAIDSETEDKIQRAINSIRRNRTTFLITHRLSQIRWADLIIVLKSGKIVDKGTHEELLKCSEVYRKIFVKKFEMEEENFCN